MEALVGLFFTVVLVALGAVFVLAALEKAFATVWPYWPYPAAVIGLLVLIKLISVFSRWEKEATEKRKLDDARRKWDAAQRTALVQQEQSEAVRLAEAEKLIVPVPVWLLVGKADHHWFFTLPNARVHAERFEAVYKQHVLGIIGYWKTHGREGATPRLQEIENCAREMLKVQNAARTAVANLRKLKAEVEATPRTSFLSGLVSEPVINPLAYEIYRLQRELDGKYYHFPEKHVLSYEDMEARMLLPDRAVAELTGYSPTPYTDIHINPEARFAHQWVLAPTGMGKTTFLKAQIAGDLEEVARGKASVILIDSQNEIIPEIAKMKVFAPGGKLHGKLVLLEPDEDHPISLNIFKMGSTDPTVKDPKKRKAYALEMIKFSLSTMSDLQDEMLSFVVELVMEMPNPTLYTVIEVLSLKRIDALKPYLAGLDLIARGYFTDDFFENTSVPVKVALRRRVRGMLDNETFRNMVISGSNKFDMLSEINQGKVILINTNMEKVGEEGCQLLGRYFIAMLLQATRQRGSNQIPTYCYVDEAMDYIAQDENVAKMFDKARKRKVGMIIAHTRMSGILNANVLDALSNAAIRVAGGNETDSPYMAKLLRMDPETVMNMTPKTLALFVRGQFNPAIQIRAEMLGAEEMTDAEFAAIRQQMRERYTTPALAWVPPQEAGRAQHGPRPAPGRQARDMDDEGIIIDGEWEEVQDRQEDVRRYVRRFLTGPSDTPPPPQPKPKPPDSSPPGRRRRRQMREQQQRNTNASDEW